MGGSGDCFQCKGCGTKCFDVGSVARVFGECSVEVVVFFFAIGGEYVEAYLDVFDAIG